MTAPRRRTCDSTGLFVLTPHTHVKIVHARHSYYGKTGTVVRVEHPHVWVALPGGTVTRAGHRSVEVVQRRGA